MSYTSGFMLGASIGKSLMNWSQSGKKNVRQAARKVAAPAKALLHKADQTETPVFACVSALPGRRRFRAAALVGNLKLAAMLEEYLPQVGGVIAVIINATTGSILLTADDERVLDNLETFFRGKLFPQVPAPAEPVEEVIEEEIEESQYSSTMRSVFGFLSQIISSKTNNLFDLKSLLSMIFSVLGIYKIIQYRHQFNGPQLLWWASTLLGRG